MAAARSSSRGNRPGIDGWPFRQVAPLHQGFAVPGQALLGCTQQRARGGAALVPGLTQPLIKGDEVSAVVKTDTQPASSATRRSQTGPGVRAINFERDATASRPCRAVSADWLS